MVFEFSGGDILFLVLNLIKFDNFSVIWFCWGGRIKLFILENEFFY